MTIKDINDIIKAVCPNDEDYEKPCISPKYLRQELEQLALEQEEKMVNKSETPTGSTTDVPDNNVGKIDCDNTDCNNCVNHKYCDYEPTIKNEAKYCDRNICLKNEYNNVGCEDCEVTKSQEPTTNNDLGVDCISRAAARSLICKIDLKHPTFGMSRKVFKDLYNGIDELPSVTPSIHNSSERIDKCIDKDLAVDCISRQEAIDTIRQLYLDLATQKAVIDLLKILPSVTPQLSSELEKNSKKLEKDFGELDCIGRDSAIKALDYDIKSFEFKPGVSKHMDDIAKLLNTIYEIQVNNIKALPSVTAQEPIKKLEEQIKQLQNRCHAHTHGQVCVFCPYECEHKAETEPQESEK